MTAANQQLTGVAGPPQKAEASRGSVRVLHVNSGNLYGGVETILVTLARLRKLCPAMQPHFAICHEGRLSDELAAAGVPVHMLGKVRISRPWTVRSARARLRELLRRERFDLVICHMPWSYAVFGKAVREAGQPLAMWAHAYHTGRGWLERLARRTTPDLAIGNSRFTEAGLENLFPGVMRGVVHPPVAPAELAERDVCRASIRQQLGAADDTTVIIQVSRMEAWKGHVLHLQALALLKDLGNWACWFVGGPQRRDEELYLDNLQAMAVKLGIEDRVRFLGQRSDANKLYACADIFCQPNQEPEPFGIVFIEALSAGLPVVSTAMGGALEIIDPSCGILAEPANIAELADALRRLILSRDLRITLGRAGISRASQISDPMAQMGRLADLCHTTTRFPRNR